MTIRFTVDKKRKIVRATFVGREDDQEAYALAFFYKTRRADPYARMGVRLLIRGERGRMGAMILLLTAPTPGVMVPTCAKDYCALRPALFHAHAPLYRVLSSDVRSGYQGSGYGVLIYAAAIALADLRGTGIVADECFIEKGSEGITSEAARRVWDSRQLAKVAHVRGSVAFLRRS